jgi:Concanavalin A-like lectin/glucanases superfamily
VVESSAGTDPSQACGIDAWPPDINNDGFISFGDIGLLTGIFGQQVPQAPARRDIAPDPPDGLINFGDIGRLTNRFGQSCAGTALDFDGTNDYVTFGAASGLGAATFTIEVWFKREGAGAGTNTGSGGVPDAIPLVTKGRSQTDGSNVDMNFFLGIQASTNKLIADFEEGPGGPGPLGQNHPVIGTAVVTSGVWHHAAATYGGGTWRLYLDGNLDTTLPVTGSPGPRSDSIQHAALGSALNSTGTVAGFFNGVLDEARIWNVVRDQAQIVATKDMEVPSALGLIGRWGMNEGTSTFVGDSSGGGINGTATNGPLWVNGFVP